MTDWNLADLWDTVADAQPDAPAIAWGDRTTSWGEFRRRAEAIGAHLSSATSGPGARVALYLRNRPEYLETLYGCLGARLVPVNTNFRYTGEELVHVWTDADAEVVVLEPDFVPVADAVRPGLPTTMRWLCTGDADAVPGWCTPYAPLVAAPPVTPRTASERSGDDLLFIYTGGTTGLPKGVMWRQDDLFGVVNAAALKPYPTDDGLAGIGRARADLGPGMVNVIACPLMHGTGTMTAFNTLTNGGCVVLLRDKGFDPIELFDTVEARRAAGIVIVGDTFARPMAVALEGAPTRWDLDSVRIVNSSGTMWSEPVKARLRARLPNAMLIDSLGSTEAVGVGRSVSGGETGSATARFSLGANAVVIDDDGQPIAPGSAAIGRLAVGGRCPIGYHKDPARTAATFPVIDGVRYSVPGDLATVGADGTIHLLGRGSSVINTGGEKVFAEEVEEVLKTFGGVLDAGVVGIDDDRFGSIVTAVVVPVTGTELDLDALRQHTRLHLAGFKVPKHIVVAATLGRAANAKLDPRALRVLVTASLARDAVH
jgi:acyl-CoA synthetase (AMP-forming)/AMP-acid ligase II